MKKIFSIVLVLALCLGLMSAVALASETPVSNWADAVTAQPEGYSESDNTVTVSTAEGLAWFAKQVNKGTDYSAKTVELAADIDLSGKLWSPIGNAAHYYVGVFDGGKHMVSGLNVDITSNGAGLFGAVGGGTTIKNLEVSGTVKTSGKYAGGIVGYSSGSGTVTIEDCGNNAFVTAVGANAAGIIGCCDGSGATFVISDCYNTGSITGGAESAAISGWLGNNATVENCWNSGLVSGIQSGKPFARFGNSPTLTNCYLLDTVGTQDGISTFVQADLASGKLCGLLGPAWGQVIGTDLLPVFATSSNTVYIRYESGSCEKHFTNDGSYGVAAPTHNDSYESAGKCLTCGDIKPGSIYETGLNLTDVAEDKSGIGWAWDSSAKILALSNFQFSTLSANPIVIPHGSTITLSGTNNSISSVASSAVGILSNGSLTIQGADSAAKLSIVLKGGTAIKCESSTENTTLSVKNLILETHPYSVVVETKANKNAAFEISDSNVRLGQITVVNTEASKTSTETAKFSVSNSTLYAQCSGANVNVATLTGNKIDVDIINSDVTLWNSGYGANWGHAYAMRLNGKSTSTINFSDSNLTFYSMHAGLWSDAFSDNGYSGSSIQNCTIVTYSKAEAAFCFMDNNTDAASNNYGDDDVTTEVLASYVDDCILLQCGSMEQDAKTVKAAIIGSPNVKNDFTLSKNIGSVSDITQYMDSNTLTLDGTLTVADGVTVTLPVELTIEMNAGSSIVGTVNATVKNAEGTYLVSFLDDDDVMLVQCVNASATVSAPSEPDKSGYTFGGWYKEQDCINTWNFDTDTVSENTTLYAKWTANTVTVTFQVNGGSEVAEQVIKLNEEAVKPSDPTKSGYTFGGWYSDAELTQAYDFDTEVTENITLYAKWDEIVYIPTYRITVESTENGSAKASTHYAVQNQRVTVTVTPDEGFVLDALTVVDSRGNEIEVTDKGNGKYTFKMPGRKVTITPAFLYDLPFTDVGPDDAIFDAVCFLHQQGLINGMGNGKYEPETSFSRAMIATMLHRLAGLPEYEQTTDLSDVADGIWYTDAIHWGTETGLITGYPGGTFAPGTDISVRELVVFLYRYAQYAEDPDCDKSGWTGATWADAGLVWAEANDLLPEGEDLNAPASRALAAQVIYKVYNLLNK